MSNNEIASTQITKMLRNGVPLREISKIIFDYNEITINTKVEFQLRLITKAIKDKDYQVAKTLVEQLLHMKNIPYGKINDIKTFDIKIDIEKGDLDIARNKVNNLIQENNRSTK